MHTLHRNPSYRYMTLVVLTALLALILSPLGTHPAVAAGAWQTVGSAGFSAGQATSTSLAVDGSGTPYVAYQDWANGNKATVMKFYGGNWVTVGGVGLSAGQASTPSLAIDDSGTPYLAYPDGGNRAKATVMKFYGGNWVTVGSAGFSVGMALDTSLAIDARGTPYLAYQDEANGNKATVMKYDGATDTWVTVGSAGFSAGKVYDPSLAIDAGGTPYLAYRDEANSNKATVMKYDGATDTWAPVGPAGFSTWFIDSPSLVIDGGTPYLAYTDYGNNGKATVMKYDGATDTWVTVGSAGFSAGMAYDPSLAIDARGTSYLAYRDWGNNGKAAVMKYDGATDTWVTVGSAGFSAGMVYDPSLAIDAGGTPYLAYYDGANGNKATVMKYPMPTVTTATAGNGSGTLSPAAGKHFYEPGDQVTLSATASTGSTFTGWSGDAACASGPLTITANLTCTATFTLDTFTITPSAGAHGSISPSGVQTANYGDDLTFTITPNAGYAVKDVLVDGASQGPVTSYTFNSVDDDHTITASFVKSWVLVGPAGFSGGVVNYPSLVIDDSGAPYVAYQDTAYGSKATVMKYDESTASWAPVGKAGLSIGGIDYPSLAIDGTTPYVAYLDYANGSKATVMKFDGTEWVPVGVPGFTTGAVSNSSLAIAPNGIPYLAYQDESNESNRHKTTVMKYDGATDNWVTVGLPGFSVATSEYPSLAFDNQGTPYLAYEDGLYGYKTTVVKYDGATGNWVTVGLPGFSAGPTGSPSLAIDGGGAPYVTYADIVYDGRATVKKYDGATGNWDTVGQAGFSAGTAAFLSLRINRSGVPYVAYADYINYSHKATVMKFDGTKWVPVGVPGFSAGDVYNSSLAIAPNGIPYLAYRDEGNGGYATVMKYPMPTLTMATAGNGSGTVSPAAGVRAYEEDSQVTLSAAASTGSTFTGWSDPACDSDPVTLTADLTCTAIFTLNTYTLTPSAGAHGSILPASAQTINYGGRRTFMITPDAGYVVNDVRVDGVSQGSITSYTFNNVTASHTITVTFDVKAPSGLSADNDGPTALGATTALEAFLVEGAEMTYTWDFGDGETGSGPLATHTYAAPGAYTATVTASNAAGSLQAETTVYVTTNPIARAESTQTVRTGKSVSLDGSASTDPGGFLPLVYHWQQTGGPAVTLTGADTAIAAFSAPPVSQTTTLTFELVVTNAQGLDSQPRVVVVTVEPHQTFLPTITK